MQNNILSKKIAGYSLDLRNRLGKGAFGEVYLGQDMKNGLIIAIKQIPLQSKNQRELGRVYSQAQNEIQIMKSIQNINVVRLFDVQRTPNNLYLVMEYCNSGTLDQYIEKKCQTKPKCLSETEAKIIMKQTVTGFQTLYEKHIVHRDLKPQNLLMHDGVLKIADFGFSKVLESNMEEPLLRTYAGSPLYMAPQILKEQNYSSKADVWSLGIIFYEILYGETPWKAYSIQDLVQKIEFQAIKFPQKPIISQTTQKLIKGMLEKDEQNRVGWEDLFRHPYFSNQMEIENERNIMSSYIGIKKEKDELRRSNVKKNLYFHEQNVVQNLQHAQQVQEHIKKMLPIEEEASMNSGCLTLNSENSLVSNNQSPMKRNRSREGIFDERPRSKSPKTMDLFYKQQQDEMVNKKTTQLIADWIIHRKNKSVFLNNLSQLWFDIYERDLNTVINQGIYYGFLFLLTKYQTSILFKMNCRLNMKKIDKSKKFNQDQWNIFCRQKEYVVSTKTIKNDYNVIKSFLNEVIPRAQKHLANATNPIQAKIFQICNTDLPNKIQFDQLFQETIQLILTQTKLQIKQLGNNVSRDLVVFAQHLQNTIKINEYFKFKGPKQIDFFKYYEAIENDSTCQILINLGI